MMFVLKLLNADSIYCQFIDYIKSTTKDKLSNYFINSGILSEAIVLKLTRLEDETEFSSLSLARCLYILF